MKKIISNDQLKPGKYYWVRLKNHVELSSDSPSCTFHPKLVSLVSGVKQIGGVWCDPSNSQALSMYDMYGPIPCPSKHDIHMMETVPDMDRFVTGI